MGLLTAEQAAGDVLGLYNAKGEPLASWVLAEARADRIPHVRLGRYVRFDADELEAWWRSRAKGPWRENGSAASVQAETVRSERAT